MRLNSKSNRFSIIILNTPIIFEMPKRHGTHFLSLDSFFYRSSTFARSLVVFISIDSIAVAFYSSIFCRFPSLPKLFNINGLKVNPSSDPCSAQCDKWFDSIYRCVVILLTRKRCFFFFSSTITIQANC